MTTIVLDDFPLWSTYLLGLVVLCGFLFALAMLIRSLSVDEGDSRRSEFARGRRRQLWFFVIAGALAVWFLASSMYLQFHAVRLGFHELQLIFFWPRPPVNLDTQDMVDISLFARIALAVIWKLRGGKSCSAASISENAKLRKKL